MGDRGERERVGAASQEEEGEGSPHQSIPNSKIIRFAKVRFEGGSNCLQRRAREVSLGQDPARRRGHYEIERRTH